MESLILGLADDAATLQFAAGVAYLVLGIVATLAPASASHAGTGARLLLLGGFAYLSAGHEFLLAIRAVSADHSHANWFPAAMLAAANLLIFAFARETGARWADAHAPQRWRPIVSLWVLPLFAILVGIAAALSPNPPAGLAAASLYFLGLPATVSLGTIAWSGYYDERTISGRAGGRRSRVLGAALVVLGMLAAIPPTGDTVFPLWLPTADEFRTLTGLPVELPRLLCIAVAAACLHAIIARRIDAAVQVERESAATAHSMAGRLEQLVADRTDELSRISRHLLDAQQLARVGSWEWRRVSRLIFLSDGFRQVVEAAPGTAPRQAFDAMRAAILPEDRAAFDACDQAMTESGMPFVLTVRLGMPDGRTKWITCRAFAERDGTGKVSRAWGTIQDVSDRKQVELELERQRDLSETMIETAPVIVGELTPDGTIRRVNRFLESVSGLTRRDLIGTNLISGYLPGEDQEKAALCIEEALRHNSQSGWTSAFLLPDGRRRTIEWYANPLRTENDGAGIVAVGVDVTERLELEEISRRQQLRLHRIIENLQGSVGLLSPEGEILEINRATQESTGVPRDRLIGTLLWDAPWIDTPEAQNAVRDAFYRAAAGEHLRRDFAFRTSAGRQLTADTSFSPIVDTCGQVTMVVIHAADVTERRAAETRLVSSEARLKEAQRLAEIGSWDLDLATGVLTWSDEIYRMFEVDRLSFPASYEAFLQTVHPEDRVLVDTTYRRSVENRTPYELTHRLLMTDGRVKWVSERGETIYDDPGRATRSRGTVQNITAAKLAEDRLRQMLAERETLLREVHHRVKNNLQMVASLLYFQGKKEIGPDGAQALAETRDRLRAMILVHEKLYQSSDLSRIAFGGYIRSLVTELAAANHLPAHLLDIRTDTSDLTLPAEVALPCGMIVCELLTNALKYAYPHGNPGRILVHVADGVITVRDDGVGMPDGRAQGAEPSFGWRLIRQLAEQIGGVIVIAEGPGTSVTLTFNATAEAA